jgi:LPS sulfotransferase NodH
MDGLVCKRTGFQMRNIARFKIPRDILNFRRIIWIRRRDIIEQAVSFAIALQTGAWTSFHEPMREPTYDYRAIASCADAIEQMESEWKRFLTQATIPYLSLFYEDIPADETWR